MTEETKTPKEQPKGWPPLPPPGGREIIWKGGFPPLSDKGKPGSKRE